MSDTDYLSARFPNAGKSLKREMFANLPTPASDVLVDHASGQRTISIKHDNLTGDLYGGNKVRKLEYLLKHAGEKRCKRIATFGSAGSNHALATALYSRKMGFDCTCFLSHQAKTPMAPATLNMHIRNAQVTKSIAWLDNLHGNRSGADHLDTGACCERLCDIGAQRHDSRCEPAAP